MHGPGISGAFPFQGVHADCRTVAALPMEALSWRGTVLLS